MVRGQAVRLWPQSPSHLSQSINQSTPESQALGSGYLHHSLSPPPHLLDPATLSIHRRQRRSATLAGRRLRLAMLSPANNNSAYSLVLWGQLPPHGALTPLSSKSLTRLLQPRISLYLPQGQSDNKMCMWTHQLRKVNINIPLLPH